MAVRELTLIFAGLGSVPDEALAAEALADAADAVRLTDSMMRTLLGCFLCPDNGGCGCGEGEEDTPSMGNCCLSSSSIFNYETDFVVVALLLVMVVDVPEEVTSHRRLGWAGKGRDGESCKLYNLRQLRNVSHAQVPAPIYTHKHRH